MGDRCHVVVLDKYFSKLPACAWDHDTFYLRPLGKVPEIPDAPWFTAVPVGKNILSKMVKTMCEEASIIGKRSNHSLRASGITKLFQSGVPEKVIQDCSEHRSIDGLRKYERISEEQQANACRVLATSAAKENSAEGEDLETSTVAVQHNMQNQMFCPVYRQQHPSCSFSGAVMNNCTFNIIQGPQQTLSPKKEQ